MTDTTVSAGDTEVTMDRRRNDRRKDAESVDTPAGQPTQRKAQRRRQIDPTTCERDYSDKEIEFMQAMDEYKRAAGRMFPTCSEILEVIRNLGYVQLTDEQAALLQSDEFEPTDETIDLDDEEAELESIVDEA